MAVERSKRLPSAGVKPQGRNPRQLKFFNLATGFDMQFFALLMIILIIGLATLYSASHVYAFNYNDGDSFFYIRKQAIFAAMGLVAMLGISMVDYHILHRWSWLIWGGSMAFLVAALFMPSQTGIHRWVAIGPISFQPSEVAKFALVLLFAHLISLNHTKMKTFLHGFLPFLVIFFGSKL